MQSMASSCDLHVQATVVCGLTSRLDTSGPFLCTVNQEPPAHFSRSIFLLGADGTAWETAAVQALRTVGFDDGVIFIGGCETEMSSDWAVEARLMSDVIICFEKALPWRCRRGGRDSA